MKFNTLFKTWNTEGLDEYIYADALRKIYVSDEKNDAKFWEEILYAFAFNHTKNQNSDGIIDLLIKTSSPSNQYKQQPSFNYRTLLDRILITDHTHITNLFKLLLTFEYDNFTMARKANVTLEPINGLNNIYTVFRQSNFLAPKFDGFIRFAEAFQEKKIVKILERANQIETSPLSFSGYSDPSLTLKGLVYASQVDIMRSPEFIEIDDLLKKYIIK